MTKMDMIWIAAAKLIYPSTDATKNISKIQIEKMVAKLFAVSITPVMITRHLVNSIDRRADKDQQSRGGSRNRYLVSVGQHYRLYKASDATTDAWDKTGPTCPSNNNIDEEFRYLVSWYHESYLGG